MVRENNGAWQLYYIGRDYLGSITNVVSESGSVGYEYSYDAWGNLRNPDTQSLYAQDEQPDLFLGRGFTGHEHLPFCNLINMNARLYDPAVGRFLSPDPYVQNSDFSQSYNRYSYAWNNPLRYTDPTGEKKIYTWDPDMKEYRDEKGQLADWSEVYKAVFESGCFRPGGSMFAEYTSYGSGFFSGSGGFPSRIVGGENGARAGWKYINVPGSVTPVHKGDTYVDNGETWTYSCDDAVITGHYIPVPDIEAWLNTISSVSGIFSVDPTVRGTWWYNAKAGWTGVNGNYYKFANIPKNNYVFNRSANIAKETSSFTRNFGTGLTIVSMATAFASTTVDVINGTDNTSTWVNAVITIGGGTLTLVCAPTVVTAAAIVGGIWCIGQLVAGDAINGWIDNHFGYR